MFVLNRVYSRADINAVLGGSMHANLPMVESRIVAVCISPILHPKGPDVIFVGKKEDDAAGILAAQHEAVPVFVKMTPGKWEFLGRYRAYKSSNLPSVIEAHTYDCRSKGVVRVVLLKRYYDEQNSRSRRDEMARFFENPNRRRRSRPPTKMNRSLPAFSRRF